MINLDIKELIFLVIFIGIVLAPVIMAVVTRKKDGHTTKDDKK